MLDGFGKMNYYGPEKGHLLRILMSADIDQALRTFDAPGRAAVTARGPAEPPAASASEAHWRWRLRMVERIARDLDPNRFGVKALYLFGSVKNATAGPSSDIDLLIHDGGSGRKREDLDLWLDGWSRSLAEMNYLRTGYKNPGLLDVHYVTDGDIEKRTSFAAKIDAVSDAARRVRLRRRREKTESHRFAMGGSHQ